MRQSGETNHNQEPYSDKPKNLPTISHICIQVQKAYVIIPLIRKAPCGQWDGGEGRPCVSIHCADSRFGIPVSDGCVVGVVDVCVGSWGRVTAWSEGGVDELLMRWRFSLAGTPGFTYVQWPLCCERLWEGGMAITLVVVVDVVTEEAARPLHRQICVHEWFMHIYANLIIPPPFTPGINIFSDLSLDFVKRRDSEFVTTYITCQCDITCWNHEVLCKYMFAWMCLFGRFLHLTCDFFNFLVIST